MKRKIITSVFTLIILIFSCDLRAQNVGIGTITPEAPLHLYSSSGAELLRLQANSPYLSFYDNSGIYQGFLWKDVSNNLVLGTACANTSGSIKLQLACQDIFKINSTGTVNLSGSNNGIYFDSAGISQGLLYGSNVSDFNICAARSHSFVPGNLILQTDIPGGNFGLNLFAGDVGIGTANPTAKLEVKTGDGYGIVHTNGTVRVGTYIGSNGGWVGTQTNHPLYFFANNSNALMTVTANGNVGIGTITPTYKLSVNGSIRTKEVIVESGWADYVFDETYTLASLENLEKYIRQNKHLPNIPSAKEIEENGLKVGDVEKRMMEKIEELTLYIIDLKKQCNEMSKTLGNCTGQKIN